MSNVATRLVGVEHRVAGFATVPEEELKVKLGRPAWHVWLVLCARRDRQGLTHITTKGIARAEGFVPMHEKNVRDALVRLTRASLVEVIGWQPKQVPCGKRWTTRDVYVRRVRGARMLSLAGAERVAVPEETRAWLESAATHGGKRMGAGRKKSNQGLSTSNQGLSTPPGLGANQGLSPSSVYVSGESLRTRSSQEKNAPTSGASVLRFEDERGAGFGGGAARPLPSPSFPLAGLPPYPGDSIVRAAEVPPPLKLSPSDPEDYQVRHLAACFRGAVERQYGSKCFLLANLSPRSKSYALLAKAAQQLIAYDTAPAAWCIYAVRRWWLARTHTGGWTEGMPVPLPPVGVIFSASQMEKRLADEEDREVVASSAQGGRLALGKTHKALLVRYHDLRRAIGQGMPREEALAKFFPASTYDDMVEAARAEAVDMRNRLEDEIKRGRMPW